MGVTWSHAAKPASGTSPGNSGINSPPGFDIVVPGNSKKTTPVDFGGKNNGWGNGDQDPPGNSGGNNNAENSDRDPPPGIVKKNSSATPAPTTDEVVARRVK